MVVWMTLLVYCKIQERMIRQLELLLRFTSQDQWGDPWTSPGSLIMLNFERKLGQMFGIKGQLDDPDRSGWQLVFVTGRTMCFSLERTAGSNL
ncbi:Auxin response factor 12 [Zea mays]|uniref:Auxin response factor 12 n=1 Tax=Zea mays TaxID=4577 RepID=A0A3L6FZU0_MAIZE|nr:Auxin response factor 12 [Zea mays]